MPSDLRRKETAFEEWWVKYKETTDLPIHQGYTTDGSESRKPTQGTTAKPIAENLIEIEEW